MEKLKIKLYGIKWDVKTAGPSPDSNKRNEVFFFGCDRAKAGNPCQGCFNSDLWDNSVVTKGHESSAIVDNIKKFALNKYVTIGGGEPLDQIDGLIELTGLLKKDGFHIMVYTWRELINIEHDEKVKTLLNNIDILVDGEFINSKKVYDDSRADGLLSSIGSENQIVWDTKKKIGYCLKDIDSLSIDCDNNLIFSLKSIHDMKRYGQNSH